MYKKLFLAVAGLSLLAGCGGGGGGTSPAPSSGFNGSTTQAVVTTSNAKTLSAEAYSGSQVSAAVSGVAKESTDNSGQTSILQQTSAILERSVAAIVDSPKSSAKIVAATAQDSVNGFSGSFAFSITYDQASGVFNGTITFSQYKETSTSSTVTGSITFSGVYSQATGTFTSMNISLNSLTGTNGVKSYNLGGSLVYSTSGATKTVAMSVVLTDNLSSRTYWVKDFAMVLTGTSLTVTGTYYDHVHGYVVISTVTPLTVTTFDAAPTSGQLLFSGANGTKARMTFTIGSSTVEADTTGNGTFVIVP